MKPIREHASDPVFVKPSAVSEGPREIELRIGPEKRGETRYAMLTPREAQRIAVALLVHAEASVEATERLN